MPDLDKNSYMKIAIQEARDAANRDEVPIGAVIVDSITGEIIAQNGNRTIELSDPTAHAEILVIREACKKIGKQRIPNHDLYVTLEPCTQCVGAIAFARIRKLTFAAYDIKGGAVVNGVRFFDQPTCHHKIEIGETIMAAESSDLLKNYFKTKR